MDAEDREELDKQIVDQIESQMEDESRWDDTEDPEFESKLESLIDNHLEEQWDSGTDDLAENDEPAVNDDWINVAPMNADKRKKYLMYAQIAAIIALVLSLIFAIITMFIRASSLKPMNLEEIFQRET